MTNLTAQQLEVVKLLCAGLSNRQIGAVLNIPEKVANERVRDVLKCFGVTSRRYAVACAVAEGQVKIDPISFKPLFLPRRRRQTVRLYGRMSVKEIATELSISENTVKTHIQLAVRDNGGPISLLIARFTAEDKALRYIFAHPHLCWYYLQARQYIISRMEAVLDLD